MNTARQAPLESLEAGRTLLSVVKSKEPDVFGDIYQDSFNMVVWKRSLKEVDTYCTSLISSAPQLNIKDQGAPERIEKLLIRILPDDTNKEVFIKDVRTLMDMFACLFDLSEVGLRLAVLSKAMCPRFHVDNIPCRLITTYLGQGSEWLHDAHAVRAELGHLVKWTEKNTGLASFGTVNQLNAGDVALMKGNTWPTAMGRGVVHRSPSASVDSPRLFLSLDMI
ncbi:DUF1826 domain-containing protein [Marinomonas spartinae]|uniref:DUF1826 domain-containing protein n=1 Tax=Marinomonas spartinae TaxID=1792290 RepID=UPI0018F1B27A|nr:DUF1826 domain-containing protein [Marinomonas spartinae]MBJ7555846.1 DUF1826 domain-containing protein [Marinomonas spartinae]